MAHLRDLSQTFTCVGTSMLVNCLLQVGTFLLSQRCTNMHATSVPTALGPSPNDHLGHVVITRQDT
eukprot:92779-Amphidinium_carterae.2